MIKFLINDGISGWDHVWFIPKSLSDKAIGTGFQGQTAEEGLW